MPHLHNGFGTWYWGRRNVHLGRATCGFCGFYGDLKSYDTTLYLVMVFIPVVPLRRKRILDECPKCRRHKFLRLKEWEGKKLAAISELTAAVGKNPEDPEPVRKFVGTLIAYQDRAAFLRAAPALAQRFRSDPELQAVVGSGFDYFNQPAEAEQQYLAAIAARGGDASHEWWPMAVSLLRQMRPAEAEKWIEPVFRDHLADRTGLLALQIEGYQAKGQHREALDFLNRCGTAFPELAKNPEFIKYWKVSEAHVATGKPVASAVLAPPAASARDEGVFLYWFRRLVGPVIGVSLLSWYLLASWQGGQHRWVHVVNGIGREYRVRVGGQELKLPSMSRREIQLAEGEIKIEPIDDSFRAVPRIVRLKSSFWSRAFSQPVAVINPDRGAVLAKERIYYSTVKDGAVPAPNFELYTGSPSYEFEGVDYPFAPPPRTIQTKSGTTTCKVSLSQLTKVALPDLAVALRDRRGAAQAAAFARTQLEFDPNNAQLAALFANMAEPKQVLPVLRQGLARRPTEIEWHRLYQNFAERIEPTHDLEAEYAAYAATAPGDPSLDYLRVRAMRDPSVALPAYERLLESPQASPYVANSLAFYALTEGQFDRARDLVARAIAADPNNASFRYYEDEILLAARMYDVLIARYEELQKTNPAELRLVVTSMHLFWKKNDLAGMKNQAERFQARRPNLEPKPDAAGRVALRAVLEAQEQYLGGDFKAAAETLTKAKGAPASLEADVFAGRYSDAAQKVRKMGPALPDQADARVQMLLYLLANRAGQREFSDSQLKWAIELLRTGGPQERIAANALAGEGNLTSDHILHLALLPGEKSLFLAAMAVRRPADKAKFLPLARKLNFNPAFPGRILDTLLAGE